LLGSRLIALGRPQYIPVIKTIIAIILGIWFVMELEEKDPHSTSKLPGNISLKKLAIGFETRNPPEEEEEAGRI
jgi:hypothetical protein